MMQKYSLPLNKHGVADGKLVKEAVKAIGWSLVRVPLVINVAYDQRMKNPIPIMTFTHGVIENHAGREQSRRSCKEIEKEDRKGQHQKQNTIGRRRKSFTESSNGKEAFYSEEDVGDGGGKSDEGVDKSSDDDEAFSQE
jgi:hypothetical protein